MNQVIIDCLNGIAPDTADKIMQCEVCNGFYPVPYDWIVFIRCRECGELAYALYNKQASDDWKIPEHARSHRLGY